MTIFWLQYWRNPNATAAFIGPSKLRSIKSEKNCSVTFVPQMSREASVDWQMQQRFSRKQLDS